jgi:hypothetical protein
LSFEQKKVERNCLKKEKHTEFGVLSIEVVSIEFFSNSFIKDVERFDGLLEQ